jgi:FtsH-binding integral membrane protein
MKTSLLLALIILPIIFIIINGYQNKLTENKFIFNTYMYILLSIIVIANIILTLDQNKEFANNMLEPSKLIPLFILMMTTLFVTLLTDKQSYIIKHISWLLFIILIAISSYPIVKHSLVSGKFWQIITTLGCIIGILSYFAFTRPLDTFTSWGNILGIILFGLIIFESFDILFSNVQSKNFIDRTKIYAWIGIIVFSGFILYDTQKLIIRAKEYSHICKNKSQLGCVDYPTESLGLFLDMINLFNLSSQLN